jgi:sodium-dependent dicarboxylate transporter 2/3/5
MKGASEYPFYKKLALGAGPVLFALLLLTSPTADPQLNQVLGIATWMIVWWVAEVIPIYVTALLPMVLFPTLGIYTVKETFIPYANPIIFLFLGGFVIALAMEERKLHIRMALQIIKFTGTKPRGIILGFMLATAFLSMWISNTATAVMMLPIALSVIQLLKKQGNTNENEFNKFALALLLSIAYSANIGGTMTLVGTPPNVVFAGLFEERYGLEVGFGKWMLVGIPTGIILLLSCYALLTRLVFQVKLEVIEGSSELFAQRRKSLGSINPAERLVLIIFLITAFLWTFKGNINQLLGYSLLHNTTIAMLGAVAMFVTPVNLGKGDFILHWKSTLKLPWGILLLFGGGLSLAAALDQVGLISTVGNWVAEHAAFSLLILVLGLTLISVFVTEIMSNVALVTVLLPVVMGISDSLGISPYYLSIPVTLGASCAFMMPISTPPNAVVYGSGMIKIPQMAYAGIFINAVAVLLLTFLVPWLASLVF